MHFLNLIFLQQVAEEYVDPVQLAQTEQMLAEQKRQYEQYYVSFFSFYFLK